MKRSFIFKIVALVATSFLLWACKNSWGLGEAFVQEDEVRFILPKWPPEYGDQSLYPELTGWLITTKEVRNQLVNPNVQEINFSVPKNSPFYLMAQPVTQSSQGESTFFHCAGGLYPYCYEKNGKSVAKQEGLVNVTWEQGFCAYLMDSMLFTNNSLYQKEELEDYLASFNWKKFTESIQTKTEDAKAESLKTENPPKLFYNPWQVNITAVKQGIAYKNFSVSLLNQVNCFSLVLENNKVLSAYIPENQIIYNYSQFSLKKNEENYFSVNNQYQMIIRGSSAKNLSTEYIFLPIIIEE